MQRAAFDPACAFPALEAACRRRNDGGVDSIRGDLMQKQTLCFLVIGTSLAVLLQNLAKRRSLAEARPVTHGASAEIIDLAAWREARDNAQAMLSAH